MSNYTVTASWAFSHNLPVIGTYGGGSTTVIMGRQITKGITKRVIEKTIVKAKPKKKGKIILDDSKIIQLGGPFQEIGGNDEVVGGGNQKVGSKNK